MYGAILGDIAGSRFEFSHPQGFCAKKEVLFAPSSRYTDDTVMTIATKYAVLTGTSYAKAYGSFGRRYKKAGYGPLFLTWLDNRSEKGYNSYGNGAAMRVSFLGHYYNSLREVEREAKKSAEANKGLCGCPEKRQLHHRRPSRHGEIPPRHSQRAQRALQEPRRL